jgi:hypothetical protein
VEHDCLRKKAGNRPWSGRCPSGVKRQVARRKMKLRKDLSDVELMRDEPR